MLYFLHVGAFLLRFSHYSYSSQRGGGGNSRQLSPLNKIYYLHGRLFAAFSLPFLHVRAFLLRFSHYNFAPAEGERASLGVRLSLKNEEKNMFCYMRGLFATFFSMCFFFATLFTIRLFAIFFYVGSLFCLYGGGGGFFSLPLLLKLLLFIFVNKMLALKFILCRIPFVANCISTRVTLFFIPFDSNII